MAPLSLISRFAVFTATVPAFPSAKNESLLIELLPVISILPDAVTLISPALPSPKIVRLEMAPLRISMFVARTVTLPASPPSCDSVVMRLPKADPLFLGESVLRSSFPDAVTMTSPASPSPFVSLLMSPSCISIFFACTVTLPASPVESTKVLVEILPKRISMSVACTATVPPSPCPPRAAADGAQRCQATAFVGTTHI
jgi:hypothetical protein